MTLWRKALLLLIVVSVAAVEGPGEVSAHPQGNSTTNRYLRLELYEDAFVLHYLVDWSEIPTLIWELTVDEDKDDMVSEAEARTFMESLEPEIREQVLLTVGGEVLPLELQDYSTRHGPGDVGLNVLRVSFAWKVAIPEGLSGPVDVKLIDGALATEPGWRTMVLQASDGTETDAWPELFEDPSEGLTKFPDDWVNFPPFISEMQIQWVAGTGMPVATAGQILAMESDGTTAGSGRLERLFAEDATAEYLAIALLLAFLFGVVEAIGPGHAKTTVAAYLASSGGGIGDAVRVSLLAAAAHSAVVYAIGALVLVGSAFFLPNAAQKWMPLISGLLIAGVGLFLFARARHGHRHQHGSGSIVVGIAGGLVPCPSSTLVMVAAVALGKVAWGMALIAAFSAGTAAVLLALGIVIVTGRGYAGRFVDRFSLGRLVAAAPAIGAVLVVATGVYVSLRSLDGLG